MDLSYSDEPREDGGIVIRGRLKHLPGGHYEDSFMRAPRTLGWQVERGSSGEHQFFPPRDVACNIFNIVVVENDDDRPGATIAEAQTKTIPDFVKRQKSGEVPEIHEGPER